MQQQWAFHPWSVTCSVSQNQEALSIKKSWRIQRSAVLEKLRNLGEVRKKAVIISRYQEITNADKREKKKNPDSNVIFTTCFLQMVFFLFFPCFFFFLWVFFCFVFLVWGFFWFWFGLCLWFFAKLFLLIQFQENMKDIKVKKNSQ